LAAPAADVLSEKPFRETGAAFFRLPADSGEPLLGEAEGRFTLGEKKIAAAGNMPIFMAI